MACIMQVQRYEYFILSSRASYHIYTDDVFDILISGYIGYDGTEGNIDYEDIWWSRGWGYTPMFLLK